MKEGLKVDELEIGKVYNRTYIGNNEPYAKINGKETFRVIGKKPLVVKILFEKYGNIFDEEIGGTGKTTFNDPKLAMEDYVLSEPESESQWYKKTVKFSSVQETLDSGLISLEYLQSKRRKMKYAYSGEQGTYFYIAYCVEDLTSEALLQTVYIFWTSREMAEQDINKFGLSVGW